MRKARQGKARQDIQVAWEEQYGRYAFKNNVQQTTILKSCCHALQRQTPDRRRGDYTQGWTWLIDGLLQLQQRRVVKLLRTMRVPGNQEIVSWSYILCSVFLMRQKPWKSEIYQRSPALSDCNYSLVWRPVSFFYMYLAILFKVELATNSLASRIVHNRTKKFVQSTIHREESFIQ